MSGPVAGRSGGFDAAAARAAIGGGDRTEMDGEPPKLEFRGRLPLTLPGAGRVLRDPEAHWPPEILERSVVEARAAGRRLVLLASPEAINEVLLNQDGAFPRARLHDRMLGASYGDNLVRGDRADWRWQRRQLLQPFNTPGAAAPEARIALACERIVDEWTEAGDGAPIDVIRDARRFTLDSLWRSFFCDAAAARAVEPLVEATALAMDAHESAPLAAHLEDLKPLAEIAMERERVRLEAAGAGAEAVDFNTMLLFLHAGHDNVAAALAWALWLLAEHPDWQARLREEWRGRSATGFDAGAFPVAGAVISETLRLYPPIMHLIREAERDLEVDGETVPGGFTTVLSLYALHRNRQWWETPDAFRPDRFLEAAPDIRRRLLWAPFGTGPRGCVGSAFARTEMIVALGTILDRLELLPGPGGGMRCRVDFVLRPEGRAAVTARPLSRNETRAAGAR